MSLISLCKNRLCYLPVLGVTILIALLMLLVGTVAADEPVQSEGNLGSPLHPAIILLDAQGQPVLESGAPVSTMQTCGQCHDTEFIEQHSYHADVGLSSLIAGTPVQGTHSWDMSSGYFGRWNPLTYRYLSPEGDLRPDLTTPEWLQVFGVRHVGGGPATTAREGIPLTEVEPGSVESAVIDPATGSLLPWDWQASGTAEMNCFLCHISAPDNEARINALQSGKFAWASTATLASTGIVQPTADGWEWNAEAFDSDGSVRPELIQIQDPSSSSCGQCHGLVSVDNQTPLALNGCDPAQWGTLTTGQVISPQRMSNSAANLVDKADLDRSWDIHAERVLACVDCHYSINNPIYYQEPIEERPDHLLFDPRRIDFGEYLYRPMHEFAKGQSAQGMLAPEYDNTLRRCDSCHSIAATHIWLPYKERHVDVLSCETCHIQQMYAPAQQYVDWTVLRQDGSPVSVCRGVEPEGGPTALITGYQPVWMPRQNADGSSMLTPYNLVASWYWVYGDPARPVPLRDLSAAWLEDGSYPAEVLAVFDDNGNEAIDASELVLDSSAKEAVIARRLESLGLASPRIMGEVQPYSINHGTATGEWAIRDCRSCHAADSRITQPLPIADRLPGGVMPTFVSGANEVILAGSLEAASEGGLIYRPATENAQSALYVLGHNSVAWIDLGGIALFLGTLAGAVVHGGLRYLTARRRQLHQPKLQRVYMYSVYERLWHWLQTTAIFILIFTGLVIHKPHLLGMFSFRYIVVTHNVVAAILVINAALSAFYHLASGEIRQFLPRPYGFFDQAIEQAKFYLQGIFRGEPHPFEKTPERKMNPLQQVTYLAILNILLPLQIITGALMWGVQQWPDLALGAGGLPVLAPIHTAVAWLFASFIALHIYLTTTGPTPLTNIKGMIMGWDDVEVVEEHQ